MAYPCVFSYTFNRNVKKFNQLPSLVFNMLHLYLALTGSKKSEKSRQESGLFTRPQKYNMNLLFVTFCFSLVDADTKNC